MEMSSMQVKFLMFAQKTSVYGFNGSMNPRLPAKGAVAKSVADSLRKRHLINSEGMLTVAGHNVLNAEVSAMLAAPLPPP